MSDPTTDAASNNQDPISDNPELKKLEQAIAEAGEADNPETASEEQQDSNAPQYGEAFQSLAEKKGFKSIDDLVTAYQNAESYSSRLSQEVKSIRDEIRSMNSPQKTDQTSQLPQEQQEALKLLRSVVSDELKTYITPLKEDLQVRKASEEINQVKKSLPNMNDIDLEQAVSLVEANPSLSLEQAAKIVTYDKALQGGQVQKKRAATTQQKNRAFVESAKTSKRSDDIDYSKLSLEELESILPSNGQFIDSKGVLRG